LKKSHFAHIHTTLQKLFYIKSHVRKVLEYMCECVIGVKNRFTELVKIGSSVVR
jgi:hypothetical protein